MYELPLFPLNTVLFPHTPIHLHIFEERYKRMIGQCMENRQPFGVVLIQRGMEALGPAAEPHRIGTTAQIVHVQNLPQGRMNIVAMGAQRFRILSLERQAYPYLMGFVEDYPMSNPDPQEATFQGQGLREQVIRFAQILIDAGGGQIDINQLPVDSQALAYVASAMLQIPADQKQKLLSMSRADELIHRLQALYRREIALLRAMAGKGDQTQGRVFSIN
jgi:Lon protease-like protein